MDLGQLIGDILKAPFICIGWIIVGALAGIIAHNIMRSKGSLIADIILGLLGAVVGGFILNIFNIGRPEGGLIGAIASLVVAIIGGVVLIALGRVIRGRSIT